MKTTAPFALRVVAALATLSLSAHSAVAASPNFVVIFIDDLGYGDIGPFGATKQKTPNLDRMASEGMKLASFYAAPVCSVSRAQLLTGCYGLRVGVPGVYFPAGGNGLNPDEVTVAERLKSLGYATACIGKWHLGDQPEFLPTRQGFDRYYGIPYSNDMQRVSAETGERVVPLLRGEKVEELLTDEMQSGIVERSTAEAVRFIEESQERPFFLYLPHTAVHAPIVPGKNFQGKSRNGKFGDWVEEVDWSVGEILGTLRRLALDKDTLVVFTSDNGPWVSVVGEATTAGPLRGSKGSTREGGVRVPTIALWPGRIAPGSTCDAVAGTIDLLPTLVSLAGGSVPAEPVLDGRDISGLLLGTSKTSPREAHYYFAGGGLQAVRKGPWKLAIAPQAAGMGRKKDQPPEPASIDRPRLYHLDDDIGEKTDVAVGHPAVVAELRALALAMQQELVDPRSPARRPAGTVANPRTIYPTVPQPPKKKNERQNERQADKRAEGEASAGEPPRAAVPAMPNIVLVLADDLGYGELGCYGNAAAFGTLMKALDEIGASDSTLVFFTSDNGPEGAGDKGPGRGLAGPLRGRKRSMYEGGHRVPGILRWPGKIEPGGVSDLPVIGSDFFPTALKAAGLAPPRGRVLDGVDISGPGVERPRPLYWRWDGWVAYREGPWKIVAPESLDTPELYNLAEDMAETTNLATREPERLAAMLDRLRGFTAEIEREGPDWWKRDEKPRKKKPVKAAAAS